MSTRSYVFMEKLEKYQYFSVEKNALSGPMIQNSQDGTNAQTNVTYVWRNVIFPTPYNFKVIQY